MRTIQNDVKKRAYIAIKYHANHGNRERIEGISTALERQGFEVVCIARDLEQWGQVQFDPGSLMQRTFNEIEASGVVVVDLTEKGYRGWLRLCQAHPGRDDCTGRFRHLGDATRDLAGDSPVRSIR
jgi:hypothetical protein